MTIAGMLRKLKASREISLATGIAFLIYISVGSENYGGWKFAASLLGFLGLLFLLISDSRIRNKAHNNR